jgi:hypothetical protein
MANVPSSPILVTPMKEALNSSETSVLSRATRRNISAEGILKKSCHYYNASEIVWNSESRLLFKREHFELASILKLGNLPQNHK